MIGFLDEDCKFRRRLKYLKLEIKVFQPPDLLRDCLEVPEWFFLARDG
jgi:hypothetical protein